MEVFYKKKKKHNGSLLTQWSKVLKNLLSMELYFRFKQFQYINNCKFNHISHNTAGTTVYCALEICISCLR